MKLGLSIGYSAGQLKVPVELVDAPLECVVLGAGRCIEAYDSLKVMFMGSRL